MRDLRRVIFLFVLLLFVPQPVTQLVFNSLIEPSSMASDSSYIIEYNPETDYIFEDKIIRITPISIEEYEESTASNSPSPPHLSPGIYPSLTSAAGDASTLRRGDILDASALSEYELLGYVPVDRGYHYWYDLQQVAGDEDSSSSSITENKIAVEFNSIVDIDVMAFSFNLSDISIPIANVINFYLADNLNDYQNDYLMFSEISFHTYNSQKNNPNAPLLFTFWNHPLTTPIDNQITADTPYYVILESSADFMLQTSSDLTGSDDNSVYTFESSLWNEQTGIDIDMEIYTGSLVQSSSLGADGASNLLYDSLFTTGVNLKIVANYYDSSLLYDSSSDFLDIIILDSFNPEFLYLSTPPTAEYNDQIQLIARVENSHHQPLRGELIDFYVSDDNQTWSLLTQASSEEDGYAILSYTILESSGTKYFKIILDLLAAYSSTTQEKETILVSAPQINCVFGSAVGSHNLALFQLAVQVQDNDGTPIVDHIVLFFMQGMIDPIFTYTNETGWATTANGYIGWNFGFYPNSYWVSMSMDAGLYNYPSTTYGDINISKNDISIQAQETLQGIWNEPLDISLIFTDAESDLISNLNYEVVVFNNETGLNTSLGLYQTNVNGEGLISFTEGFFEPGEYMVFIKVNALNYIYLEKAIPLLIESDQATIYVNIVEDVSYIYGSSVHLEVYVTDHFGNPLEDIQVLVHVSLPNYIDFWDDIHVLNTNSSGYAVFDLILSMNVGDVLNILFTTAGYYNGDILYYKGATPFVAYFTCVPAPTNFVDLVDISCTNQETITISGRLFSNGNPISSQTVCISILGEQFFVITDSNGYFTLTYQLNEGGTIQVDIFYDSSTNYLDTDQTIYLYCDPCTITLTGDDIYHDTADPVTFIVLIESAYGTNPQGVAVDFYWYDGENWIYLDTVYSDVFGVVIFTPGISFPLGNYLWKAEVALSEDWEQAEVIKILKVGIDTSIVLYTPSTVEYHETITLTAYVTDEPGNPILVEVAFYINQIYIGSATTDIDGYAVLTWFVDLAPGDYEIVAQMAATGMFLSSSNNAYVTIEKTSSYISCDDEFIFYSESADLEIHLYTTTSNISTVYVTVNITDILEEQLLTDSNGLAIWSIALLDPGVYTVRIYFMGNSFYYSSELLITLQVDKMPTTINFTAPNQEYEPIYEVTGYINDQFYQPIEGVTLVLYVNGTEVATTTSDVFGYFEFVLNLNPGIYVIEIEYSGDDYYLSANGQKTVYIWKIETSVQSDVVWEDMTVTVETLLLDSNNQPISNQLVFFYLDGIYVDHTLTNSSGYAFIILNGITPGIYELEIVFSGTTIYSSSSQTIVIDQDKLQTEMIVEIFGGIYGTETTTIEVYLTSEGNPLVGKNVVLIINGQNYAGVTNSSGYLLISLDTFTNAGTYSLSVDFLGDAVYTAVNIGTSFYISKAESQITLQFNYLDYLPILSGVLITPTALAGVDIFIYDGVNYLDTVQTDALGNFEFFLLLSAGTYQIEVEFEGDENHLGFRKIIQVQIYKTTVQIDSPASLNQTYGAETSFIIYVEDVLGNSLAISIIIKLDGIYYATIITNASGYATVILTADIEAGNHILTLEFQGNDDYYQTSQNISIYTKYEIILDDLQTLPSMYGDEGLVTGELNNYGGNLPLVEVTLIINGEAYTTTIDPSGSFIFVIDSDLPTGTYSAILIIEETTAVVYFEHSFMVERTKGQATINLDYDERTFNDISDVVGSVEFDSVGLEGVVIVIYINGNEMGTLVTDINGQFVIPGSWLEHAPGLYTLKITALIDNANIAVTSNEFALELIRDSATIEISYVDTKVEQELQFNIQLTDSQHNNLPYYSITITVNGTEYELISNGAGVVLFTLLLDCAGVLYILLTGLETTYYNSFAEAYEVEIERTQTIINVAERQIPYNDSKGLAVQLKSEFGNAIANQSLLIMVDSNVNTPVTDENGTVYINIEEYALGNHSLFIDFADTENYLGIKLYANMEIVPQETQIIIVYDESQVYLQLLDSEGRILVNRDVTFQYLASNGSIIASEDIATDYNGKILIDLNTNSNAENAEEVYVVFKGEKYYNSCDILLIISDFIVKMQQGLLDPYFFVYSSAAALFIIVLTLGSSYLLKKRKR